MQLRARIKDGDWNGTLSAIADREHRDGNTHLLVVQDSPDGFVFAALVPVDQIAPIWHRQRAVSDEIISRGATGRIRKNHAANGSSPTLYLQDDRFEATPAVARVFWDWPGVVNVLALPRTTSGDPSSDFDTLDDLTVPNHELGRDGAGRIPQTRSGYPRDPKVRRAVLVRADGRCERDGCGEICGYDGFFDVHHILGIEVSDRAWTCVALCPNCHREAHFSPERDALNEALGIFAAQFR